MMRMFRDQNWPINTWFLVKEKLKIDSWSQASNICKKNKYFINTNEFDFTEEKQMNTDTDSSEQEQNEVEGQNYSQ